VTQRDQNDQDDQEWPPGEDPGGFPSVQKWLPTAPADAAGGPAYAWMIAELREFLDAVAGARPDTHTVATLAADLEGWKTRLAEFQVDEREQVFARRIDLAGRGQTMSPALEVLESDSQQVDARVIFGRYFLGGGGAVHGGAVPLMFDELLGRLANSAARTRSRTAYLHVDYRSITPVGVPLRTRGWFVSEEGRKRVLRGELWHGDTLCAEAEGLFVALRPHQP
jgi:acyl-coenzyme A thioesterase PaaI-like protein